MLPEWIRPRALILMAVVFLALVVVLLWIGENGEEQTAQEEPLQLSRIQIKKGDELVDLSQQVQFTDAELSQLVRKRLRPLVTVTPLNERRAAALQLALMTNDPAERERLRQLGPELMQELRAALFKGLGDKDPTVAANCRNALVGFWRITDGAVAAEYFSQGLAAYEAGQLDRALQTFQSVERLGGAVPPDLYRVTAEIYLAQGQFDKALDECRKAVAAEPKNFPTLYVIARIYHAKGNADLALKALDGALKLCPQFPEAQKLRQQILQAQPAPAGS